jgi:hypothetical protein
MQHGIQSTSRDQGHPPGVGMQPQFQHIVGRITHQFDGPIRKPSAHQADHLMGPHGYRLVMLTQQRTDAVRVRVSTLKYGNAQRCFVQGSVTTTD